MLEEKKNHLSINNNSFYMPIYQLNKSSIAKNLIKRYDESPTLPNLKTFVLNIVLVTKIKHKKCKYQINKKKIRNIDLSS